MIKFIFFLLFTGFSFLFGAFFYFFEHDWIDFSLCTSASCAKPSIIFDDQGNEFARFALDRREPVSFSKLPDILVKAFIAAEDHRFFMHCGISFKGILRSMCVNIIRGRVVQGASTITQQLARGMFLSREQTLSRKIREMFLAFQLERHFTKEQIFERYVNNVYFGRGIYGVEAACQRFWNKSVFDISVDEAATLVPVAKSARLYSPLNAPENAKRQRDITLRKMRRCKFISQKECETALKKELVIKDYLPGNAIRLYIQEHIRQWAEREWGKEALYTKGLRIQSTINSSMQALAEQAFCKKVRALRQTVGDDLNGGMLCLDSSTGKIKVCIGGYDFYESQYNRVFQAERQMGSSFKPIVYTAAMLKGIEIDTVMVDEPVEMQLPGCNTVWRPRNWDRSFDGPMTLARALSFSNNIITIKTLLQTGIDRVLSLARQFGLSRALAPYPSIALGTTQATVEESAAAFNVFANNGMYVQPYLVSWVKNQWGKKLWEHEPCCKRVLPSKTNSKMVNVLSLRMQQMKRIVGDKNWVQAEVIGKSGSTNGAVTTWFVGATPELTTSIYLGRDDNKPMGRYVFGSQTAYPIWLELYKALSFEKKQFYVDPELRPVAIDWVTGDETFDLKGKDTVVILK